MKGVGGAGRCVDPASLENSALTEPYKPYKTVIPFCFSVRKPHKDVEQEESEP